MVSASVRSSAQIKTVDRELAQTKINKLMTEKQSADFVKFATG